jgi:hypothetical protein
MGKHDKHDKHHRHDKHAGETDEEKRARRLAKKEAKRAKETAALGGYSNDANPWNGELALLQARSQHSSCCRLTHDFGFPLAFFRRYESVRTVRVG